MKIVRAADISRERLAALLAPPAWDRLDMGERGRRQSRAVFGEELPPPQAVARIVAAVREEGDVAVARYTRLLDGVDLPPARLKVAEAEFAAAYDWVRPDVLAALRRAAANVAAFHQAQRPRSWRVYQDDGVELGQNCLPLERVGIYVPGGTAAYPSSVLMNAVPAKVAGVREIIMAVPPARDGGVNPYVLVAAREAGVDAVYRMGGAQAIAALAYGTATVPKVDKITGPGNIFVTLAKKAVYGAVDIDMLAGPSEIMIIADGTARPAWVAADMLSQAEHDPLAASVLVTDQESLAQQAAAEVERQLAALPRREIAAASLAARGLAVVTADIAAAVELANQFAPEHLELMVAAPAAWLPYVRHAGAVFLGAYTPEPLGDYLAGPNHVLPTGGTARFYSGLSVETFMKKTNVISYTPAALAKVADDVLRLARTEGLEAHARAVAIRRRDDDGQE